LGHADLKEIEKYLRLGGSLTKLSHSQARESYFFREIKRTMRSLRNKGPLQSYKTEAILLPVTLEIKRSISSKVEVTEMYSEFPGGVLVQYTISKNLYLL
jgi:hypothetical protein